MSEIQNEAIEIIKFLKETLMQSKDFTLEQAPLVAQEIVLYGRVYYLLIVMISIILCFISMYLFKKGVKIGEDEDKDGEVCLYIVGAICIMFGSVTGMVTHFHYMILSWTAPRLYIIEHLRNMI